MKKKRENILVKNVDGQTSFLNEVQRRRDFEGLKKKDRHSYRGVVDTTYASLINEIILSPWIEGNSIKKYTKALFENLFDTLFHIEIAGLFEYDLCSGNLLEENDGLIRLFDFGYMYPFNPLTDFNSDGKALPMLHSVERFETRSYMQYLMNIEDEVGLKATLDAFRIEKAEALKYYQRKKEWLINNQADSDIIEWFNSLICIWMEGLSSQDNLRRLYDLESFRSYVLDIHDDVSGESCSPDTLLKIGKVILKIESNYDYLRINQGLFWGDEKLSKTDLYKKYSEMRDTVKRFQIEN